ncbi:MAG TPA: ATP-binding protein, partial [Clostridia bacterium]
STKKTNNNYGLGLTYCYNVMLKHEGDIRITSDKNSDTRIYLIFSNTCVLKSKEQMNLETSPKLLVLKEE